jgi:hypothetical protein
MKYIFYILVAIFLNGCIVNSDPHQSFIKGKEKKIGKNINTILKMSYYKTSKYHIEIDKDKNKVYHFFLYENQGSRPFPFFPRDPNSEDAGKCMIYYVVDPTTNIIIDWGFDIKNGANPKTCAVTG